MKIKNSLIITALLLISIVALTACGGITEEQKGNWTSTYNELETKMGEHNQAIAEINEYFTSISEDIQVIQDEVGNFKIKDVVNENFNLKDDVLDEFSHDFSSIPPEKAKDFELRYANMLSSLETLDNIIKNRPSLNDIKTEIEKLITEVKKEIEKNAATAQDIVGLWGGLIDGDEYSLLFSVTSGKQACELSMGGTKFNGTFVIDKNGTITISVSGVEQELIYKYDKSTDKLEANIPKLGGWTNLPRVR